MTNLSKKQAAYAAASAAQHQSKLQTVQKAKKEAAARLQSILIEKEQEAQEMLTAFELGDQDGDDRANIDDEVVGIEEEEGEEDDDGGVVAVGTGDDDLVEEEDNQDLDEDGSENGGGIPDDASLKSQALDSPFVGADE